MLHMYFGFLYLQDSKLSTFQQNQFPVQFESYLREILWKNN